MTTRAEVFKRMEGVEITPGHRQLAEFVFFFQNLTRAMWFYNLSGVVGLSHRIAAPCFRELQDMGLIEPYPNPEKPWAMALTAKGCCVVAVMNEQKKGACYLTPLL